jgi:hypothetical protein
MYISTNGIKGLMRCQELFYGGTHRTTYGLGCFSLLTALIVSIEGSCIQSGILQDVYGYLLLNFFVNTRVQEKVK